MRQQMSAMFMINIHTKAMKTIVIPTVTLEHLIVLIVSSIVLMPQRVLLQSGEPLGVVAIIQQLLDM